MSQKVLVAGTGISGISAAKLLLAQGGGVVLYDGNEKLSEEKLKAKFDEGAKVTIVLGELNKMISFVKENEDEFVRSAMDNSVQKQSSELAKSKKKLKEVEKRIAELDRLFTRLYEDNVSGKISDARFAVMSAGYEDEQKKLRATVAELTAYIDTAEQKSADVTAFIRAVQKYEHITELTPEVMHELIEKIVIRAPDKSSGHRTQQIEIHYRFDVAITTAVADSMKYDKKRKAA